MLKLIIPMSILCLMLMFNKKIIYWWSTTGFLLILTLLSLPYLNFNSLVSISNWLMIDLMSSSLIILSLLIASLMMIASTKIYVNSTSPKLFTLMNVSLLIILVLCFSSSSIMSFYIWFEASLIPTMIIIMTWGYQPERIQASMYLIMYTVTASLPMLIMLILAIKQSNHSLLSIPMNWTMLPASNKFSSYMWLIMIMGFLVKLPMFSVHLWLPKAHVEAPIAGSMVLAAILLKLGGYGLLRLTYMFNKMNSYAPSTLLLSISLWGAILTSMICIRQPDIKSLIAYSSVGHMGLMLAGIMSNSNWSMWGSLMMMIAHGLCSSGLFILANLTYEITHTRSMFLTKGMMTICPTLTMWWFMFTAWNMAAPPSINLMSEIFLLTSIMSTSMLNATLVMTISFLAAAYSLNMYTSTQHGHIPTFSNSMTTMKTKDMLLLLIHLYPILMLIIKPEIITLWN